MRPSSLNATAPARAQPATSTISAPASARVAAATTITSIGAAAARARASSTRSGVSTGGSVLAIATMRVKPPAAAARAPLGHGLGVLVPGLAQVDVEVDEAGREDARRLSGRAGQVDDGHGALVDPAIHGDDPPLAEPHVLPGKVDARRRGR